MPRINQLIITVAVALFIAAVSTLTPDPYRVAAGLLALCLLAVYPVICVIQERRKYFEEYRAARQAREQLKTDRDIGIKL